MVRVERVVVHEGGQAIVGNVGPGAPRGWRGGVGMNSKGPKNPVHRLPDWRVTLPLAPASGPGRACRARSATRCGAKTRAGGTCQQPAMLNGRCRMHGGRSTGPRTAKGLERIRAARTTHGLRTAEMALLRKLMRDLREGQRRVMELVK